MAIEGLQHILEKEPVVGTPTADRLVSAPEAVDAAFKRHVRSYVPFGRASGAGEDDVSIADYEARLISLIKAGGAPKGYVSADFGYGKTSTALHLWDRCRTANLLAVPPFRLGKLDDLILATHGWSRYEIDRRTPALVPKVDALYRRFSERSVEADSAGDAGYAAHLRRLLAEGRYTLSLTATDYVAFLEETTALAREAGFDGLVVLPDEIQQYISPSIYAGSREPIAPLHDIVEGLVTRKGQLQAGLIFSIPTKELGVINDQRGDLVQRLKMDRLGLDLRTVYDKRFAGRLWRQLAKTFDFAREAEHIITPAALDSLGQIAARDDLANGPRTVISAFKFVTARFMEAPNPPTPLDPIGLVDAFLDGQIPFDGTSKLQRVVQDHLEKPVVAARPEYLRVVKLLGAFPTDGASPAVVTAVGLAEPADELSRLTHGDVVITAGGGRDGRGEPVPYGLALRGLEPTTAVATDWLTQSIREFSRHFLEQSDKAIERAEAAFLRLLTRDVFREPNWKVKERISRRLTDNPGLLLEGSFESTRKRFPERTVYVRLLREGETPKGGRDADVVLNVVLDRHLGLPDAERRIRPGSVERGNGGQAKLELNLFHHPEEGFYPDLQAYLQPVVSPSRVTPLLMLALHEAIEEQRRARLIPKETDREVEQAFQPALFDHALDELFNADLGAGLNARGPRVVEELFRSICEARFPEYRTVMNQSGWQGALLEYETSLERLSSRYEKQGETEVEGTKEEIALLFNRKNTAFDSFVATFPDLITVTTPFRGREPGKVRFKLHPFEEHVRRLLQTGETTTVSLAGQKMPVHVLKLGLVNHAGVSRGYRQVEIDALLSLMVKRDLVEVSPQRGTLRQVAHPTLRIEDLTRQVRAADKRVSGLLAQFPNDSALNEEAQILRAIAQELAKQSTTFDDQKILLRAQVLRNMDKKLFAFLERQLESLRSVARAVVDEPVRDAAATYKLREPVSSRFFGPQLDAVRMGLLARSDAQRGQRDLIKTQALELLDRWRADAPTDSLVLEGHATATDLRQRHKRLRDEATALDGQGTVYGMAGRVLVAAVDLEHQLQMGAGQADTGLRDAFDALMGQIQAELSSSKAGALNRAANWETELGQLRNRLNQRQSEQREAFEARKVAYLNLLQQYAHLRPSDNPLRVSYNPADPGGSSQALAGAVSATVVDKLEQMVALLNRWTADVHQILASGDLAYQDDPRGQEAKCRSVIREAEETALVIVSLSRDARDEALVIGADDASSPFLDLLRAFDAAFRRMEPIGRGHKVVTSATQMRRLEPCEQMLLDHLGSTAAVDGMGIDIGMLLSSAAGDGVRDANEVWQILRALYEKRRVHLQITLAGDSDQ